MNRNLDDIEMCLIKAHLMLNNTGEFIGVSDRNVTDNARFNFEYCHDELSTMFSIINDYITSAIIELNKE